MRVAIITVAGISSRFNQGIFEDEKILKCIYYEENPCGTLIYQMLKKLECTDKIVVVGGYKFNDLTNYIGEFIPSDLQEKIIFVDNPHYRDLSSGYSLYLGIKEALDSFNQISKILFVEGDLDVDHESFLNVIESDKNVLTFNREPIYSNNAVVLYQDSKDDCHYLFNSDHGLLTLDEPFKAVFNSGQIWKFQNMDLLKVANDNFKENLIEDTNLGIIQKYFDLVANDTIEILGFNHWVNCNTRKDYSLIKNYWEVNVK